MSEPNEPFKPRTYPRVLPYLVVSDAGALAEFVVRVLEGRLTERLVGPDGQVRHAEVRIGSGMVMMGSAGAGKPPFPGMVYVYVPDTDAAYARALDAGATSLSAPADQFYGDRSAGVLDPWGNQWWIATHIEAVSPEELARRAAQ